MAFTQRIFLFLFLALYPVVASAQEFQTGLLFNESAYNDLPQLSIPAGLGFAAADLPPAYNLKSWCPYPGNQGQMYSCLPWALGYGIQTIEAAIKKHLTDRTRITQEAFAAMYIYNYVKSSPYAYKCGGSFPEPALNFVKNNGNVQLTDYNPADCTETPPSELNNKAYKNKIRDWVALFRTTDSDERKLEFIKNAIAQDHPLLICMRLTRTFYQAKGIWNPGEDPNPYGEHGRHAMVLIGYDDNEQTVEIMNSWGTEWGNNGFIKMTYDDFITYLDAAYQVISDEKTGEKITLGGKFVFRYSINLTGKPLGDAGAYYNTAARYYELTKKDWQLDQRFQLSVSTKVQGQYLYVFSVNTQYKSNLHFPTGSTFGNNYALDTKKLDIVPLKSEFIIPEPERAADGSILKERSMKISPTGTDYLIILYSAKSLKEDLATIMESTRYGIASGVQPANALDAALGSRLISPSDISYTRDQVAFSASAYKGYVVPLIIRVESK